MGNAQFDHFQAALRSSGLGFAPYFMCCHALVCILDGGWSLFGRLRVSICFVATVALVVAYAGAALAQSTADIAAANGTAAQPPNKTNQLAAIAEVERAASWMA